MTNWLLNGMVYSTFAFSDGRAKSCFSFSLFSLRQAKCKTSRGVQKNSVERRASDVSRKSKSRGWKSNFVRYDSLLRVLTSCTRMYTFQEHLRFRTLRLIFTWFARGIHSRITFVLDLLCLFLRVIYLLQFKSKFNSYLKKKIL